MDERYFRYCSAMAQARILLENKIISETEYVKIDQILSQKYKISPASLFRDIRLIYASFRGNMPH